MKKMFYSFLVTGLVISGGLTTVSAADTVDRFVDVTIQGNSLDLTATGDISFGIIPLTGETQTRGNVDTTVAIAVSDKTGDTRPWNVHMTLSELQNGETALAGQSFAFTAAGSTVSGDGVTAGADVPVFSPLTSVNILNGDVSAVSGGIDLLPGFLTLTVGSNATAGEYTGTATFSVIANP